MKIKVIVFYLIPIFFLLLSSLVGKANVVLPADISVFEIKRRDLTNSLSRVNGQSTSVNVTVLLDKIEAMKSAYGKIQRKSHNPLDLYQVQFQLRLANSLLKNYLDYEYKENRLSKVQRSEILYQAQLFDKRGYKAHLSPQKSPSFKGISGPSYPLDYWAKESEYYNYTFKGDAVLFRNLLIKSGDVIFNYTTQKPVGIFTAVGEKQNVFPHVSLVVFFQTPKGRLPLVMDVYKQGMRLIPLHHFLTNDFFVYSEVFRQKNRPLDFENRLDQAGRLLMSKVYPYDLIGALDRNALSCPEMIDYLLELTNQKRLEFHDQIKESIYKNVLKFGYFERKFLMPNDIFFDDRYEYVGYLDSTPPIKEIITNDLLIEVFRGSMDKKVVKDTKGFLLQLITDTIQKMRDRQSMVGSLLLKSNGFDNNNFPVGDNGLIGAVGVVDLSFQSAMMACTDPYNHSPSGVCNNYLEKLLESGLSEEQFSVLWWRNNKELHRLINNEVGIFNNLFE